MPLTLLTPRWIALHVATVVAVLGFGALGWWQFGAYRVSTERQELRDLPAVPLAELVVPRQPIGSAADRAVVATGIYLPDTDLVVPARVSNGVLGVYAVAVLQTSQGALPVLRGWLDDPQDPGRSSPSDKVTVTGHLLSPETSDDATDPDAELPPGQTGFIAPEPIAEATGIPEGSLYQGYLLLTDEEPQAGPAPERLDLDVVEPIRHVNPWQNLSYSVLWWVFAGAAAVFWFSSVRATVRGTTRVSPD